MTSSTPLPAGLSTLQRRLDATVAQAHQRQRITTIAVAALLAVAAAYLWYLHSTVREFADAPTLVELAAAQVDPHLQVGAVQLGEQLRLQAPAVIDHAETLVLQAPPQIAREAQDYLAAQFDEQITGLESEVYKAIGGMLQESLARARTEGIDLDDAKQVDGLVDAAAPMMRTVLKEKIAEIYTDYKAGADGVGAYIAKLTSGGPLSNLEKRHREILLTGLAIIKQIEADPSRAPLQKVIEGRLP